MTSTASKAKTRIGVVMGSSSDWDTMQHAVQILQQFGIDHEAKVVSAHRMPDEMFTYAETALERGLMAIIAGAGGAAHLPGMLAAKTVVPVLGVPVASKHLQGVDSLHSIVQMPKGIPVATFAIGAAGAANASHNKQGDCLRARTQEPDCLICTALMIKMKIKREISQSY